MDQYVDWMLAVSQDARWLQTKKYTCTTPYGYQNLYARNADRVTSTPPSPPQLYRTLFDEKQRQCNRFFRRFEEDVQNSVSETIPNLLIKRSVRMECTIHLRYFPLEKFGYRTFRAKYLPLPNI